MTSEITLKYISQISGFSISTISKALNDKHDVSKSTKSQIKKLAASYNYIPNSSALALRKKKTKIIAVIVPHINSIFYSKVLSEIQANAFKKSYKVLILQSFGYKKRELECIDDVMDGCVDGIIVIKSSQKDNITFKKPSSMNGIKFYSCLIYINVKLSLHISETKSLGEKYFKTLLRQIN